MMEVCIFCEFTGKNLVIEYSDSFRSEISQQESIGKAETSTATHMHMYVHLSIALLSTDIFQFLEFF